VAEERSTVKTPAPASADAPGEIRDQIERTREDLGRTIDELQDRLSPQHVMQQAKDTVHEATVGRVKHMVASAGEVAEQVAGHAQDGSRALVHEAREHPVTAALLGAGVAWLVARSPLFTRREPLHPDETWPYDRGLHDRTTDQGERRMGNGQTTRGWTDIFREHPVPTSLAAASLGYLLMQRDGGSNERTRSYGPRRYGIASAQDRGWAASGNGEGRGMADTARRTAQEAREAAGAYGSQAMETVGDMAEDVQERWDHVRERTVSEFDEWMDENPLAVGAAALAVGLAIGFTSPRTRWEDETMGATRDALIARTSEMAEDGASELAARVTEATADDAAPSSDAASQPGSATTPFGAQAGASSTRRGNGPVL